MEVKVETKVRLEDNPREPGKNASVASSDHPGTVSEAPSEKDEETDTSGFKPTSDVVKDGTPKKG